MYLTRRNVKSVSELYLPSCMRHTSVCRPEGEPAAAIADRQRLLISCHHWKENTARRLEQPGIRFWMKLLKEDAQDRFHRAEKVLPVPNAWRQPSYPENFFNRLDPSLHKYVPSPSCRLEGRLLILNMCALWFFGKPAAPATNCRLCGQRSPCLGMVGIWPLGATLSPGYPCARAP